MMPEQNAPDPKTFDVDAYIEEVTRPEISVDVYGRGDLYGDITALESRIEVARTVARHEEETLDGGGLTELENEYEALLEKFAASKITLRLRALGAMEEARIREEQKGKSTQDIAYHLIHAALLQPNIPDYDKFERFLEVLGKGQGDKVANAYSRVQAGVMRVSPDFLQRRSSPSGSPE